MGAGQGTCEQLDSVHDIGLPQAREYYLQNPADTVVDMEERGRELNLGYFVYRNRHYKYEAVIYIEVDIDGLNIEQYKNMLLGSKCRPSGLRRYERIVNVIPFCSIVWLSQGRGDAFEARWDFTRE